MLNVIWAFMILLAVLYGTASGHMGEVTNAALDSAGEAISLCFTMAGVVALWMGLMEIAQQAGLVRKLTRGIEPFLRFMFPRIPKGHPAEGYIATNVIANVLGLGWACTPAGLKAMEELAKLEAQRGNPEYLEGEAAEGGFGKRESVRHRQEEIRDKKDAGKSGSRRASNEMCIFLILNISSLQLIPVNMIAYRAQYGSANPTAIIAPAIAATLVSTLAAIVYCKGKDHGSRRSGELKAAESAGLSGEGFRRSDSNKIQAETGKGRRGKAV